MMFERLTRFARAKSLPAVNPAGEGNYHPGPYTLNNGWLPNEWGKFWNFWQMDYDPLAYPACSIVDACVWAYVAAIAQLPGYHKIENDDGGIENVTTSALSRLLRFPNTYETQSDFLTHLVRSLLYTGNSYWLAVRNARNEVVELHWLNPRMVRASFVKVDGVYLNEIFYSISNDNEIINWQAIQAGEAWLAPGRNILHIKLATDRHPLIGESPLRSLAGDLAARGVLSRSIGNYFTNASRPSGVVLTDLNLTKQQIDELKGQFIAATTGESSGGVAVLTRGIKWTPTPLGSQDMQLVDALKLSDASVCGVFGVPGVLVGLNTGQTFATTEALMNYWLANRLGHLLNHIEVAIDQFIGLPANEWTEYDTDALLRTDLAVRIEALTRGVQGGIFSPNEARNREGLPNVEAGDEPRVQQQVVPLSFAATPPAELVPAPAVPPSPAPPAAGQEAANAQP